MEIPSWLEIFASSAVGTGVTLLAVARWGGGLWERWFLQKRGHQHERDIEEIRHHLTLRRLSRALILESIHAKRLDCVAELFSRMVSLRHEVEMLYLQFDLREIREDVDRMQPRGPSEEREPQPGLEDLSDEEQVAVENVKKHSREFWQFFMQHRLYLPKGTCSQVGRFQQLATFASSNYRAVATKDREGNLYVNKSVKETWDLVRSAFPAALKQIEREFRDLMGSDLDIERKPADEQSEGN